MENREEYLDLINKFILGLLDKDQDVKDNLDECIIDKDKFNEYKQKHTIYSLQNIKEGNNIKPETTKLLTDGSSKVFPQEEQVPQPQPVPQPEKVPQPQPIPPQRQVPQQPQPQQAQTQYNMEATNDLLNGGADIIDLRTIIDFKKLGKKLVQKVFYQYSSSDVSSIVKNGIKDTSEYKLFLGGASVEEVKPKNIYECWKNKDSSIIILMCMFGIVNYQVLKYAFLKTTSSQYRNKKKMEEDIKNNKDAMAKYIKLIYEEYPFPQMKKFIDSTASLFNYSNIEKGELPSSDLQRLFSFYLLKDFFKRNNNEYLRKDLKEVEYKPLTNKTIIPLRLLHGSVKPDIHFDKMIADRYTNSSKSFTPNDLTNLLGMMNFQEKLKNQVGGGQYGGSHLYEHIFDNLSNKLAGYKIKINHNDEAEIRQYIKDLADNEKKIVDSLDTIKKFTYSKNIADYKGYEVSVDDMYNEIIKTRKDSADKEDKLMGFITKLNRWIKEHFNE